MHSLLITAGRTKVTVPVEGSGGDSGDGDCDGALQARFRVVVDQQIVEVFTGQTCVVRVCAATTRLAAAHRPLTVRELMASQALFLQLRAAVRRSGRRDGGSGRRLRVRHRSEQSGRSSGIVAT